MWLLVLFLVASPALLGVGVREAARQRRLRREGISVQGRVAHHHVTRGMGGSSYAVVDFVDTEGGSHRFTSRASGVRGLPVGGRAPVRYFPGAPESAQLDLSWHRSLSVVLPLAIGTAFLAGGVWALSTGL